MRRSIIGTLLGVALLALGAAAASADELTVDSILSAHRSGAPAHGIISMVNNPANTVAMTAADLVTLRTAGVPLAVITAVWNRVPAPTPAPAPLQPDDARLLDIVRLINFKIVKGDHYQFQDRGRDSGSNAAVVAVMEALRTSFPRLNFGTPDVND